MRVMRTSLITCLLFLFSLIFTSCNSPSVYTRTYYALDTVGTINLYKGGSQTLLDEIGELLIEYEKMFSSFDEEGEIYKLNNSNGKPVELSEDTIGLIRHSMIYSALTDGLFDISINPVVELWDFKSPTPRIPDEQDILQRLESVSYKDIKIEGNTCTLKEGASIDLGGIAKGYIVDKIKQHLVGNGVKSAIINMGGNISIIGTKDKSGGFRVGIQRPFGDKNDLSAIIEVSKKSVVTSGTYERGFKINGVTYHHIVDATTGYPVQNDLDSVTIISETSVEADALSTSLLLLGSKRALELAEMLSNIDAILILKNGDILTTDNFENKYKMTMVEQ